MNNNNNYNLIFQKLNDFINSESNKKIEKTLKDIYKALESMNELNQQEQTKVIKCLIASLPVITKNN
jgi:flagellin-specific chaperone FliS